jgi:archaeal flagellar protein FlaJ
MFEPTPTPKRQPPSAGNVAPKPDTPSFGESYRSLSYSLFGKRFDSGEGDPLLAERLKRAGYDVSPGMFRSVTILTALLTLAVTLPLSLVLFRVVIHVDYWYGYVALVVVVAVGSVFLGFNSLVSTRIANRKDQLDRELPFTLSELSVLASTGTSPVQLVRRMAARDHDLAMTGEFKRVVYKMDLEGKDLISALAETGKQSASTSVREAFWDLANMIHQGGSLDEYLRTKADDVLKLKRLVQKQFIERLSTFLDMYVSLVLVGVLMIAVGAFLINALGQTVAGLDANELLLVLTFGLVPLAVVMTVIMISIAYARAE